ncbi:hypothetical protein vseg_003374 [Gypsophila vaccaria]
MQESLNFPTATATATATTAACSTTPNPLPSFLPFSRLKTTTAVLATLSSKPSQISPISPLSKPQLWDTSSDVRSLTPDIEFQIQNETETETETESPAQINNDFQDKIYFLDSQGLDPLSNFPPSAVANSASLSDMTAVFDYLTSLGFTPPDLRRAISMCPQILSLRLLDIAPVFTFLIREACVPATSLPRAIRRRPRLLISDVDTRLRPTMYFLQSIGIHEVYKHTDLLSSSVEEKYLPKVHYFEKLGFSHRDALSMFRKFPSLFCYSVKENYEPKLNYFVVEMGRELRELKEFPQYFSFSLENRIKPRHHRCVESRVCFPLATMLKMKEDTFRERLELSCSSTLPKSTSPLWSAPPE